MAVTTQITSTPQYILSGGSIPGCIGGGEDYRTLNNNTVTEFLYIRGWAGDNISSACVITEIVVKGCKCKLTSTSGGNATSGRSCNVRRSAVVSQGSVSGTNFNRTTGTTLEIQGGYVGMNRNNYASIGDNTFDFSKVNEQQLQYVQANKVYPGVKIDFKSSYHIRGYIKGITLTVTRTRACYITFKGDGVTEKTTMYDYGTVPSYGSTPTRDGYTFKGWSNGSTTYSGTLPTAYEQDVTYTAVWERVTYYLDLNGLLDGSSSGSISPYGTADVYINGSLAAQGVSDYYTAHPEGTTYEIKNIKANTGYKYNGNASYSGTLTAATSVVLSFSTKTACTITYNGNGATSGSVAAQSGYVGDSLTLRDNGFYKKCIVTFYSNEDPSIEDDSLDELQPSVSSATFLGWYTAASGGSQVTSPYTPTSASVTLYAHWSGMSAVTTPTLTRDGYTFLGWYTARSGGSKVADGGSYTPTGNNIALYAHWKLNEITDIYIGTSILDVYIGNSKYDVYQGTTKIYG